MPGDKPVPRTQAEKPPNERLGWLLVALATLILAAELAAIPIIRHSDFLRGAVRGLNVLPIILAVSGVRMIMGARKARTTRAGGTHANR